VVDLPKFHEFMRPLLEVLKENGEMYRHDAINAVIKKVGLTEEQKALTHETNGKLIAKERVGWASSYLSQGGCLVRPKRGYMALGTNAEQFLNYDRAIKVSDIKATDEWKAIHADKLNSSNLEIDDSNDLEDQTPQDLIEKGIKKLRSRLIDDLLENFKSISPHYFEKLVLEVLAKMGYGGGDPKRIQGVPRGPDGGIDGTINEDKLGLDQIYIQAKRYSQNPIGRPAIDAFVGVMIRGGCKKGVFVTSSRFTSEAIAGAKDLRDQRLILIDGNRLANLMIEYCVGVQIKETIPIAEINQDFFSEED
tara:strand:+ start:104 stop:1024 length:921 start_codon:yes stop_codon:yes gene_type:complete